MHFVAYLYIMYLITTFISVKPTRFQVNSANVNVFVMRLCVQQYSGSIESLNECQLFSSVCRLTMNCEESDCSLVNCHIVFLFMWHCASASIARIRHKQYERSEMKVKNVHIHLSLLENQPSGM
jgi:hypothetical protein